MMRSDIMENYEKLLILLEMSNVNISPFIKIKNNNLLLAGSKDIDPDISYSELLKNYNNYINPINGRENPFFTGLGVKKQVTKLEDIVIHNYKNNTYQKISEVLFDEDLIDTQKQDIIYRGFQEICNEYKYTLNSIINNDISIANNYFKFKDIYSKKLSPKWVKKRNLLFWFCSILLLAFNYFFVKDSNVVNNILFYRLNAIIFNLLVIIPFLKIVFFYYLKSKTNYSYKKLSYLKYQYDLILDLNDKNIDRLEKDLYYFYSNTSKSMSISYLEKTNRKLKKLSNNTKKIMTNKFDDYLLKVNQTIIKIINLVVPLSFVGLIVLYFILK